MSYYSHPQYPPSESYASSFGAGPSNYVHGPKEAYCQPCWREIDQCNAWNALRYATKTEEDDEQSMGPSERESYTSFEDRGRRGRSASSVRSSSAAPSSAHAPSASSYQSRPTKTASSIQSSKAASSSTPCCGVAGPPVFYNPSYNQARRPKTASSMQSSTAGPSSAGHSTTHYCTTCLPPPNDPWSTEASKGSSDSLWQYYPIPGFPNLNSFYPALPQTSIPYPLLERYAYNDAYGQDVPNLNPHWYPPTLSGPNLLMPFCQSVNGLDLSKAPERECEICLPAFLAYRENLLMQMGVDIKTLTFAEYARKYFPRLERPRLEGEGGECEWDMSALEFMKSLVDDEEGEDDDEDEETDEEEEEEEDEEDTLDASSYHETEAETKTARTQSPISFVDHESQIGALFRKKCYHATLANREPPYYSDYRAKYYYDLGVANEKSRHKTMNLSNDDDKSNTETARTQSLRSLHDADAKPRTVTPSQYKKCLRAQDFKNMSFPDFIAKYYEQEDSDLGSTSRSYKTPRSLER